MININPKELYEFLKNNGISHLYHANTVTTSCTFIRQGGLLSRGAVESKKLLQTPQDSDTIDKKYNVWNDIFLDVLDLHKFFPRENYYGPVCFVLKSELLLDNNLPNLSITANNPIYWSENNDSLNYINSLEDYINNFETSCKNKIIQQKMITIHSNNWLLPFNPYLVNIILDNPYIDNFYDKAYNKLSNELINNNLNKSLLKERHCTNCFCSKNYKNKYTHDDLEKLFL